MDKGIDEDTPTSEPGGHHCTCSHHRPSNDNDSVKPQSQWDNRDQASPDELDSDQENVELSYQTHHSPTIHSPSKLTHAITSDSKATAGDSNQLHRSRTATIERNSRHVVASTFERIGDILGTPAPEAFDDSRFQRGPAADFPEVPGELERNAELNRIKEQYSKMRDAAPLRKQRSRTGSFISERSETGLGIEVSSEGNSQTADTVAGPSNPSNERSKERRSTLEVPKPAHRSRSAQRRFTTPESASRAPSPNSPTIRVSDSESGLGNNSETGRGNNLKMQFQQ